MAISFHAYRFDAERKFWVIVGDEETFELSLCNANAIDLLSVLGFEDTWSDPPQPIAAFPARITAALQRSIGRPSPKIADMTENAQGRATIVHCGREEGYLGRKLHDLAMLAREGPRSRSDPHRMGLIAACAAQERQRLHLSFNNEGHAP